MDIANRKVHLISILGIKNKGMITLVQDINRCESTSIYIKLLCTSLLFSLKIKIQKVKRGKFLSLVFDYGGPHLGAISVCCNYSYVLLVETRCMQIMYHIVDIHVPIMRPHQGVIPDMHYAP